MCIYYPSILNYELKLSMLRNDILPENVLKDWPTPVGKCTGHLNKISVFFGPGGVGGKGISLKTTPMLSLPMAGNKSLSTLYVSAT